MGSLERRIEHLEGRLGTKEAASNDGRQKLVSEVWRQTLDAMARIRRAPIDDERVRYEIGRLRDKNPMVIACHIIALAHLGHEDEEEARRILAEVEAEREIEESPLWEMIDRMVAALGRMREQQRGA
jgi:hypothetical protein